MSQEQNDPTSELDEKAKGWSHIRKLTERPSPFCHEFEAGPQHLKWIHECRVLVVGAGGLGCEILKNLALLGFKSIEVIDMDIIDLSNLNRQFLFRLNDVGKPKAEIAANFIKNRLGVQVKAHFMKIQDKDPSFYKKFNFIVCGLDSIEARRWLNETVVSLVKYTTDEDGSRIPDQESMIPIVDGGTEGFQGNARIIIPKMSPCLECSLWQYPPPTTYPACTIAHKPRLPEHCIEYVRVNWEKEHPFGPDVHLDGDDPAHINWIFGKAVERASEFNITGVTYRLTQGVVKNIIPAVASTNAIIAAACATEVFKFATSCAPWLNNYMYFQDRDQISTSIQEISREEDCPVCSTRTVDFDLPPDTTLENLITLLKQSEEYKMENPTLSAMIDGTTKNLFMRSIQATHANLPQSLKELGISHGGEISVSDPTLKNCVFIHISYRKVSTPPN